MYEKYLDTWTMREVFNVTEDIYLVPGNRFQITANSDGRTFSVKAVAGELDKDWETCTDLTPAGAKLAAFGLTQPFNSTDLSRTIYQDAFLTFLLNTTEKECLKGTVILRDVSTAVSIYVDDSASTGNLILLSIASAHQNGTGHGDNR
jgi:hypothetical protein